MTTPGPASRRIAAELRAELARQQHSGRWLAEQIGATQPTMARWLKGTHEMPLDALLACCKVLDLSIGDLLALITEDGNFRPVTGFTRRNRTVPNTQHGARGDIRRDVLVAA